MGNLRSTAILGLSAAILAVAPTVANASTHSTPYPPRPVHRHPLVVPTKLWLIKDNDLAIVDSLGTPFDRLFRWVACGAATWTGPTGVPGGACKPGQVPTFASYPLLKQAITDGQLPPGSTILFDQEPWSITPAYESANPVYWAKRVAQLCWHYRIRLVFTAAGHGLAGPLAADVAAAPWSYAVSVQTQKLDGDPREFYRYARRSAEALRAANPRVKVMFGLAPDAGGKPVTLADMLEEYHSTYPLADGFWLNSNAWGPPKGTGCAPQGCPVLSDEFLGDI